MRRSAVVLVTAVVAVCASITLTGCGVGAGVPTTAASHPPTPSTSTASSSPSSAASTPPVSHPTGAPVAADTLIHVTTTVAQPSGAKLALSLTVHAPVVWNSASGTPMAASMAKTCSGEEDQTVFASGDYHFVEVDVTATAAVGAWGKVPVGINPVASASSGFATAAVPALTQVEILGSSPGPGDYVPHCQQPAVLTGPGSGKVYFAWGTDGGSDPATAWASVDYGFSIPATPDGSAPTTLTFSGCSPTVTTLAKTSVPGHTWTTGTNSGQECITYS